MRFRLFSTKIERAFRTNVRYNKGQTVNGLAIIRIMQISNSYNFLWII